MFCEKVIFKLVKCVNDFFVSMCYRCDTIEGITRLHLRYAPANYVTHGCTWNEYFGLCIK